MPISSKELLKNVPFSEVILRSDNPRTNEDTVMPLALSLLRFGLVKDSVGVDENNEVWYGNTTTKAIIFINEHPEAFVDDDTAVKYGTLREMWMKEYPGVVPYVTRFYGLTQEEKLELRIADNKIPESSGWNIKLLKPQLVELLEKGRDLSATGFPPSELNLILQDRIKDFTGKDKPNTPAVSDMNARCKNTLKNYEGGPEEPGEEDGEIYENDPQRIRDWKETESSGELGTGDVPYVVHLAFSTKAGAMAFLRENGFDDVEYKENRRIVTVDMAERAKKLQDGDGEDGEDASDGD